MRKNNQGQLGWVVLISTFFFILISCQTENNSRQQPPVKSFGACLAFCQPETGNMADTVKDIDGNVYNTITIGEQVWMAENLKVTRYRNGDPIPKITKNTGWNESDEGACCYYENNSEYGLVYGCLYNWYAVNDSRSIAPKGWKVPAEKDWQELIDFLGGEEIAGKKLKEGGLAHWKEPNGDAINSTGFKALPGGYRDYFGNFSFMGYVGSWWCAPNKYQSTTWYYTMTNFDSKVLKSSVNEVLGFSVRCIKEKK